MTSEDEVTSPAIGWSIQFKSYLVFFFLSPLCQSLELDLPSQFVWQARRWHPSVTCRHQSCVFFLFFSLSFLAYESSQSLSLMTLEGKVNPKSNNAMVSRIACAFASKSNLVTSIPECTDALCRMHIAKFSSGQCRRAAQL